MILARPSRGDESSSEYSQRRSYSSSAVEEKPSSSSQSSRTTESGSTSTIPKTSSDIESDSKKRSRSFVRPPLRSAVPDSHFLSFARKPVQSGRGRKFIEKQIFLNFSNYFSWSTN